MKTPHRLQMLGYPGLILLALLLFPAASRAGSGTWDLNPKSGDWTTAANWSPKTVPNGPFDMATFGLSQTTAVAIPRNIRVASIIFDAGATSFAILAEPGATLRLSGTGIENGSGVIQSFTVAVPPATMIGNENSIQFAGSATAGDLDAFTAFGGTGGGAGAAIEFADSASAATSTFLDEGAAAHSAGGRTRFHDTSSAAAASFTNHGGIEAAGDGGRTLFFDTSTAANATITNEGGTFFNAVGGVTEFHNAANAGTATISCEGGSVGNDIVTAGGVFFYGNATADHATITCSGGVGSDAVGALVAFNQSSTAGAATLIANGGRNGGLGGTLFVTKDYNTARIEVFGNGRLTTGDRAPGAIVGSIEGSGLIDTGDYDLAVGANNLSTTFSGRIHGFSLTKVGSGTLTLTGSKSNYSGGTTVGRGALVVSNKSGGMVVGTGPVNVIGGTLGGDGTIVGPVTIGSGSGAQAFLAPAHGEHSPLTLSTLDALTFQTDGNYTCTFQVDAVSAISDQVAAAGVAIDDGIFLLAGTVRGPLPVGTTFTVINNTATTRIVGTFANLADDAIISAGGTSFQASYEGGDGNDLTLTVVP